MENAATVYELKNNNRKRILEQLRFGALSRVELSKRVGLAKSSVTVLIGEMIKEGLLRIEDGRKIPSFGSIHTRWAIEKRILKERYNYDYKTPAEKNPFINYD